MMPKNLDHPASRDLILDLFLGLAILISLSVLLAQKGHLNRLQAQKIQKGATDTSVSPF